MNTLKGEVTAEKIAEWKEKYGKVFKYEIEGMVCYLRNVDRASYALAASKVSTSPAKFDEVILDNIWLGGDDTIRKKDNYYFGLTEFVQELMDKRKGTLGEC